MKKSSNFMFFHAQRNTVLLLLFKSIKKKLIENNKTHKSDTMLLINCRAFRGWPPVKYLTVVKPHIWHAHTYHTVMHAVTCEQSHKDKKIDHTCRLLTHTVTAEEKAKVDDNAWPESKRKGGKRIKERVRSARVERQSRRMGEDGGVMQWNQ